jgi:hypothetical protein
MRRFYELVRASGAHQLDPEPASVLEVDWWRSSEARRDQLQLLHNWTQVGHLAGSG